MLLVSDGGLVGAEAWLESYHGTDFGTGAAVLPPRLCPDSCFKMSKKFVEFYEKLTI